MPILQGPMRGYRWIVGSSVHGCWLGSYEFEKRRLIEEKHSIIEQNNTSWPHVLKIDVEGAELRVLQGARTLLQNGEPTLFLATHSRSLHAGCIDFLEDFGFYVEPLGSKPLETYDEIVAWKR